MGTKSANINGIIFSIKIPCKSSIPLVISYLTFKRISVKIALSCSYITLHHGDFAGVVDIFVLKCLQKFENFSETNSPPPPLSINTFYGLPNIQIQFSRKFLIIVALLLLIMVTLLNQANSSIICKHQIFLLRL